MKQLTITALKLDRSKSDCIPQVVGHCCVALLFLLIVVLPNVIMPELIQPIQNGKFLVFVSGLIVIILLFSLQMLFRNQWVLHFSMIDASLGILFLYVLLNRYLLQEVWGFSLRYYEFIGLTLLYIFLRQFDSKIYFWLMFAMVISGIIQSISGILQLWGCYPSHHSGFRMTGGFFNPAPYAGFLAGIFPIALGLCLFGYRFQTLRVSLSDFKISKCKFILKGITSNFFFIGIIFEFIPIVGVFSLLVALLASQSRAAWLAVITSSLFLVGLRYNLFSITFNILNTYWRRGVAGILLVVGITGGLFSLYQFKKGSVDGRLLIWKVTTNIIIDHLWFGVGIDRFQAHYMNYQAEYFTEHGEIEEKMVAGESHYAFNEPLQFVVEQGLIGLMFLLSIFFIVIHNARKSSLDKEYIFAVAGIFSVFIFSCFSYPSEILSIKLCLVVYLAVIVSRVQLANWKISVAPILRPIFGLALVLVAVSCLVQIGRLKEDFRRWGEAMSSYGFGQYEESVNIYRAIYSRFAKNGEFLIDYGKALSMAEHHWGATKILGQAEEYYCSSIIYTARGDSYKALGLLSFAEADYNKASYMIPCRFYPKYLLAKMYTEFGRDYEAQQIAHELLTKEIKVSSIAVEEILAEMREIVAETKRIYR